MSERWVMRRLTPATVKSVTGKKPRQVGQSEETLSEVAGDNKPEAKGRLPEWQVQDRQILRLGRPTG
jgi:hypothetical protein